MFNKKKIQELEDRIWQLENPPKYKIGDKYSRGVIICVKFRPKKTINFFGEHVEICPNYWEYRAVINHEIITF